MNHPDIPGLTAEVAAVLDVPRNGIVVYWKGDIPSAVAAELDRDRTAGIAVTIVPA